MCEYNHHIGETQRFEWHGRMGYVHIDDVAACHILVYELKDAQGRYLCSSTVVDIHELASILSARYPGLPIPTGYSHILSFFFFFLSFFLALEENQTVYGAMDVVPFVLQI